MNRPASPLTIASPIATVAVVCLVHVCVWTPAATAQYYGFVPQVHQRYSSHQFRGGFQPPMWQQFGAIDPWYRPARTMIFNGPVWGAPNAVPAYGSPIGPVTSGFNQHCFESFHSTSPVISNSVEQNSTAIGLPVEQAPDSSALSDPALMDSISPGQSVPAEIVTEGRADQSSGDSDTGSAAAANDTPDLQSSASDLATDDPLSVDDSNSRYQLQQLQLELQNQQTANEQLQNELQELWASIASGGNDRDASANELAGEPSLEQIERWQQQLEQLKVEHQQQLENETKKIRKEAAWEIAKARKEADQATGKAEKIRDDAEQKVDKLVERLKSVESKLADAVDRANSAKSRSAGEEEREKRLPGHHGHAKEIDNGMTLDKLAEQKRKARVQSAGNKGAERSSDGESPEMLKQLERSTAKIRKRFERKIERAREEDDSKKQIRKLRQEMQIQIEKMEARIRNRFRSQKQDRD